jgi:RNA polymerase sigma-70 factor (ECF subfamily)
MLFRTRANESQLRFDTLITPHAPSAYNLARWLLGNDADAEDVLQDSLVRAFRSIESLRTTNVRAWLLQIVRNMAYTTLRAKKTAADQSIEDMGDTAAGDDSNPMTLVLQSIDRANLHRAIDALPVEYREAIVLRELEGLSYREISEVSGIPIGTVMSRLARARTRVQQALSATEVDGD